MSDTQPLGGRTAIVTGASSGIGRAIAETLGRAGAHVVLAGRTAAAMDESRKRIAEAGGSAAVATVDMRDPAWKARVRQILEATVNLVSELGGTLSGEHGDGRVRAPFIEPIWGLDRVESFRQLKRAFDPNGILNPGVILPLPRQDALDGFGEPAPVVA